MYVITYFAKREVGLAELTRYSKQEYGKTFRELTRAEINNLVGVIFKEKADAV
jgi:hypothetical protein